MARVDTRMWYDMGVEDTPLSDGAARSGERDDRKRPINGADSSESTPIETIPSSGAHALSGSGENAPSDGAHTFLSEDRPDSGIAGDGQGPGPETDNAAVGDPPAKGPVDDLSHNSRADSASAGHQSADSPVDDLPADDPVDDLPAVADGEGMSPVVREYVERLRHEALARDAELRARGIDPYKGTPVDEGPRRRLGARALAALVVLVAAVSVGAYVVFFRGEPDYGMSHGYQVQSDGSLKRPPITDKAPDKPAEMSKGDEAGAEATARYYLKTSAYAWNTGDTGQLTSLGTADCNFCQDEITNITNFYAQGYWAVGTYSEVLKTELVEKQDETEFGPNVYDVQFHINEHGPDRTSSSGFKEGTDYDLTIRLRVQWNGKEWHLIGGNAIETKEVQ